MDESPLLRLALPDGRTVTLLLGPASTVLSVGDTVVSSWDLGGRPYALVREDGTYRRGLDGRFLHKREAGGGAARLRRRLSAREGAPVVEAARRDAESALVAIAGGGPTEGVGSRDSPARLESGPGPAEIEARRRLNLVVSMDAEALAADAARFLEVCGPVGILPPDQYLALVVRATEGCSWSACTFCSLYRDTPFRSKTPNELRGHLAALRAYFGESIALRRGVFLGDANALCLAHDRLLRLLDVVAAERPASPLFSFVDAWTGHGKTVDQWRSYAARGLERVYVGLETGAPDLLAWLGKPGTPQDAVELAGALHEAGVSAGVIVLLGAGGTRFAETHVARTAEILSGMRLGSRDLLYFSELVADPTLEYGRRASGAVDLQALGPEGCARQREAILSDFRPGDPAAPPRAVTYDIREFVY